MLRSRISLVIYQKQQSRINAVQIIEIRLEYLHTQISTTEASIEPLLCLWRYFLYKTYSPASVTFAAYNLHLNWMVNYLWHHIHSDIERVERACTREITTVAMLKVWLKANSFLFLVLQCFQFKSGINDFGKLLLSQSFQAKKNTRCVTFTHSFHKLKERLCQSENVRRLNNNNTLAWQTLLPKGRKMRPKWLWVQSSSHYHTISVKILILRWTFVAYQMMTMIPLSSPKQMHRFSGNWNLKQFCEYSNQNTII